MLRAAFCLAFPLLCLPASAAELSSAYTEIDLGRDCSISEIDTEGGESAQFVCPGWRGYPVIVSTGDLRESLFYGFPPSGKALAWESFSAFNSTGPKIEWRIETGAGKSVPIATIHRWFVSDPEDDAKKTEVLVVEKVGLPGIGDGCAVGMVVASGSPQANETARRIADESARDFACGADEPMLVSGDIAMPAFDREQN
jgi:hypothetical protein